MDAAASWMLLCVVTRNVTLPSYPRTVWLESGMRVTSQLVRRRRYVRVDKQITRGKPCVLYTWLAHCRLDEYIGIEVSLLSMTLK